MHYLPLHSLSQRAVPSSEQSVDSVQQDEDVELECAVGNRHPKVDVVMDEWLHFDFPAGQLMILLYWFYRADAQRPGGERIKMLPDILVPEAPMHPLVDARRPARAPHHAARSRRPTILFSRCSLHDYAPVHSPLS